MWVYRGKSKGAAATTAVGADERMSSEACGPIDLAPGNPYSLLVTSPVIVAPGCDIPAVGRGRAGAIVSRVTTRHTRHGAPPRFAAAPAGVVVSSVPSVSIRTLLKEDRRRWDRVDVPVLVCLQGDAVELAEMARALEDIESIAGLVVAPESPAPQAIAAARRETQRPLLAALPHAVDLPRIAVECVGAGADALVVAQPPQGAAGLGERVSGHLLGPAAFPFVLQSVIDVMAVVTAPVIALGGIANADLARAMLTAGAAAVMVDAARWGDPQAPARIAAALHGE